MRKIIIFGFIIAFFGLLFIIFNNNTFVRLLIDVAGIGANLYLGYSLLLYFEKKGYINLNLYKEKKNKHKVYKLGLDIHGIIDGDPKFFALITKLFMEAGHEVHILTGSHITDKIKNDLNEMGIMWTHLFSISDHHESNGVHIEYDAEGTPWISDEAWDKTKAEYCAKHSIDHHIDDTERYGKYFTTPFSLMKIKNYEKPKKKSNPLNK